MNQSGDKEKVEDLAAEAVRARSSGDLKAAEQLYLRILGLASDHQGALHNLGVICTVQGRLSEAVEWFERVLKATPDAADIHSNLGVVFKELGNSVSAMLHLSEAIRLRPDYAAAHNNLGALQMAMNDPEAAYGHFRRASELEPNDAVAWANTGRALLLLSEPALALEPLQRATVLAPEMQDARFALGAALFMLGRYAEAIPLIERALAVQPGRIELLADLVHARQHLCDWTGIHEHAAEIRRYVVTADRCSVSPFYFTVLPGTTALEQRSCAEKFSRGLSAAPGRARSPLVFTFEREPVRKLRIGYLHDHFDEHATMHLLVGVLERHDRSRFEIVGVSYGKESHRPSPSRARAALDDLLALRTRSDEEAARAIHGRGIHILIDAQGYNRGARPGIFSFRPAPVQAAYLVFPGTTGSAFIDYLIADRFIIPPEQAAAYTEQVRYLPVTYQCNDDKRERREAPARSACGLPDSGFVFCCFNQTYKITPEIFGIWCRLLREVPGSVLWLWASNPGAPENLRREARARGISPERLIFAPTLPYASHWARIALADLFLDTFPCNAHTTASDALWAGVPLVTCCGETFVSRVAGSLLHAVGLPELIATSLADYEALALALARDPAALSAVRRRLAENRATAPLFDTERQTRDLEAVYEDMWREYLTK